MTKLAERMKDPAFLVGVAEARAKLEARELSWSLKWMKRHRKAKARRHGVRPNQRPAGVPRGFWWSHSQTERHLMSRPWAGLIVNRERPYIAVYSLSPLTIFLAG